MFILALLFTTLTIQAEATQFCRELPSNFSPVKLEHAKNFKLYRLGDDFALSIDGERFLKISDTSSELPCSLRPSQLRLAVLSSSHLAYLAELEALDKVVAIDSRQNVFSPSILKRVERGEVIEVGHPYRGEKVLSAKANLVTAFSVSDAHLELGELNRLSLPIFLLSEFKESHPLARSEWLLFFGALTGKFNQAQDLFSEIKERYQKMAKKSKENNYRLLLGQIENNQWIAPGPKSDMITLFKDLNIKTSFSEKKSTSAGPLSLSMEEVILELKKNPPTHWLPVTQQRDRKGLLLTSRHYRQLNVLQEIPLITPGAKISSLGANDYWERGVVRPDLVMEELFSYFFTEEKKFHWFLEWPKI